MEISIRKNNDSTELNISGFYSNSVGYETSYHKDAFDVAVGYFVLKNNLPISVLEDEGVCMQVGEGDDKIYFHPSNTVFQGGYDKEDLVESFIDSLEYYFKFLNS